MLKNPNAGTISAAVMVGNHNWKEKPAWVTACAFLFGRHQTIIHLGKRFRFAWYGQEPFLYHVSVV